MTILDRIRQAFTPKAAISSSDLRVGDAVWETFTGGSTGAPSEASAMALTAVWACNNLIAGAIASLPMHIYKRDRQGDLTRDYNNDLWWVLNEEFSPRWPASAGWEFLVTSNLLHGDGFAEIVRTPNGRIKGLVPIHPYRVEVICLPDASRLVYKVQPDPTITAPTDRTIRVIDQDDMLHIAGFGFNGLRGLSALKNALRVSGRVALNAQDFSSSFLQNMGRPDFALKSQSNLKDDQFNRLMEMLDKHKGPGNSGRPMVLEGGLDIQTIGMPLEEMQLLETRKFQVEEIARAFGVQPFMIGHTEKTSSWGTGVEAMGAGFVRYTLRRHLNAFQNEINRKFFRTIATCAEFDTTELERGDTASMFSAVRVALGRAGEPAFMTVEEGRSLLRLPREMDGTIPNNDTGGANDAIPQAPPV